MAKEPQITHTRWTISNRTIIRVLTVITVFWLGIEFIWATRQIWVLLVVSFFLALAFNPPVSFLSRRLPKGSRGLATAIAYLAVLSVLTLLVLSIAPPLIKQSRELVNNIPTYIDSIQTSEHPVAKRFREYGLANDLEVTREQILNSVSSAGTPLFTIFRRIGGSVAAAITVLVLTFLMLVEGPRWLNKFWSLQPRDKLAHRQQLAKKMYHVVTGYVNGQLLIAFIAGLASFLMLTILKVPFALPLASIVSILGLIPLIGATLGGVMLVIVGLFQSTTTGIILLIFFVLYQQFENYVLYPAIQSRALAIPPLLILVAALFGVQLAGLLGALLAIPAAGSLRILANDYIERHHLTRDHSSL